jgi:pimeloyl-ACP methyl ester carboxylesterase
MAAGSAARGPMFVYWETPEEAARALPIVLVHGGGGQGTDYMMTPDGRPGWAQLLVEQGWTVYVVDRPAHGRSPYNAELLGPLGPPPTLEFIRYLFAPPSGGPTAHSRARLHSQWPGTGEPDDALLAQLAASGQAMLADWGAMHALERLRLAELLDEIGPAVVIAHSAGAPAGFLAADARPELVRALIAIEPIGPPFAEIAAAGISLEWGLAAAPLQFDPPAHMPGELALVTRTSTAPEAPPVTLQAEPARKLSALARVPIALVSADASRFYDIAEHFVAFLEQAGCGVDPIALGDHGLRGNGHGMMFERNHAEVLQVLTSWLESRLGRAV